MARTFALGLVVAAAISFTSSACAARSHDISPEQVAALKPGVATYDDVVKALGRPMSVSTSSDGSRIAVFGAVHASPKAASFIPVVGLFAGGATSSMAFSAFIFGPDGVLRQSNTTSATTDCSTHFVSVSCDSGASPGTGQAPQTAPPVPRIPSEAAPSTSAAAPVSTPPPPPPRRKNCLSVPTDPQQSQC